MIPDPHTRRRIRAAGAALAALVRERREVPGACSPAENTGGRMSNTTNKMSKRVFDEVYPPEVRDNGWRIEAPCHRCKAVQSATPRRPEAGGWWTCPSCGAANHLGGSFPHFGACPACYAEQGLGVGAPLCLNIKSGHFMVCDTHRVFWFVGSNLFSSWRDETEEMWQRNAQTLDSYREVEPAHW